MLRLLTRSTMNILKTKIMFIILFTTWSISNASKVIIISSGNENNIFETTGTLRIEWKDAHDCNYLGLIKMDFIPDNPAAFGKKIAYVWPRDMSDAVLWEKSKKLGYEEDKHAGEEVLRLAKKIFKNLEIGNRKNDYCQVNSNSFNIKLLN